MTGAVDLTPVEAPEAPERAPHVSDGWDPLLVAAHKTYRRPGSSAPTPVLRDLTLLVRRGRCTALVAPNGSGKSTVARAVLGIDRLDSGERAQLAPDDLRAAVLQDYRSLLVPNASVRTNLALPFRKVPDQGQRVAAAERHLAELGYVLPAGAPVGQLSGGQQQSIVLARALAARGRVLVWDEATSALDYRRRGLLYVLLWRLWAPPEAPTVLLITHDIDEALLLATEVVVLDAQLDVVERVEVATPTAARGLSLLQEPAVREARDRVRGAMLGTGAV